MSERKLYEKEVGTRGFGTSRPTPIVQRSKKVTLVTAFRPMPMRFRERRRYAVTKWYARFYGNYETKGGRIRRFSFAVQVTPHMNMRLLQRQIAITSDAIRANRLPEHYQGQVFAGFGDLWHRANWFHVRKVRNYEAGVVYER